MQTGRQMEGRERDCEKLRKKETIRETKQGLRWQQRRKRGGAQRREGARGPSVNKLPGRWVR